MTELRKGAKALKFIVLAFNIVFLLLAICMLAVAGLVIQNLSEVSTFATTNTPAGLVVLGVLLFYLSFLGCVGSARANLNVLLVFFFILWGILVSLCMVLWTAYLYSDVTTVFSYQWGRLDERDKNLFQSKFDCCGFYNNTDRAGKMCPTLVPCELHLLAIWDDNIFWMTAFGILAVVLMLIGLLFTLILLGCLGCCRRPVEDDDEQVDPYGHDYIERLTKNEYIHDWQNKLKDVAKKSVTSNRALREERAAKGVKPSGRKKKSELF